MNTWNIKEKLVSLGSGMLFSPLEVMVREVTSNEPYPSKSSAKEEIAQATFIG
jgi:hypothetical protein